MAPELRALGFRGSRQTFRKRLDDVFCVVNFQGSRSGQHFFVNLAAQPTFIPAEGGADPAAAKEYECILRNRVGGFWLWAMPDADFNAFKAGVLAAQDAFFEKARSLSRAVLADPVDLLLRTFTGPVTTEARIALHLARAALVLRDPRKAEALARRGLELAGDARTLRAELEAVVATAARVS